MKPTVQDLQIVNSRLPGTSLSESQIEILPFRLFDNQQTDRYTHMSIEMLRKLVKDANDGKIALNSLHRSNSTLPVGRSVEARLLSTGDLTEVQVKMYAVTARPDGSIMEDGKDLADRYNTGAVYACSAGVYVGYYKCSICGNDIRDWQNCDHYPGETYVIDEKPVTCTALMTGKDIQGGVAMDCGCYECSAVTAGGVRNASILTDTFSQYDKTTDIKDFKKAQFDKSLSDTITLMPFSIDNTNREEVNMSDQDKGLLQKNYELIEAKAKVDVELVTVKAEFANTQTALANANTKLSAIEAEFEASKTALTDALATKEEFAKKVETAEAAVLVTKEEFEAKEKVFEASKAELEAFKAAYIAIVEANGVKIGREADYASKTVLELSTLNDEYLAEIAKFPSGQQSDSGETQIPATNIYAGIPDDMFKSN